MENKQQTAVEYLIDKIISGKIYGNYSIDDWNEYFQEAHRLHKQQVKTAYDVGKAEATFPPEKSTTGEQYYNETYEKQYNRVVI